MLGEFWNLTLTYINMKKDKKLDCPDCGKTLQIPSDDKFWVPIGITIGVVILGFVVLLCVLAF